MKLIGVINKDGTDLFLYWKVVLTRKMLKIAAIEMFNYFI